MATTDAYIEPGGLSHYIEKDVTDVQQHEHNWILEKTGYDPAEAKSKAQAFLDGCRLSKALVMAHQRSPENKERTQKRREEAEEKRAADEEAKAERKAEREAERKRKREESKAKQAEKKARAAAAEAEEDEDDEDVDVDEAENGAKAAPKRRGRPAKKKAAAEAPF